MLLHLIKHDGIQRMACYVYNFNGPDNSGYNVVSVLAVWLQINGNVTPFVFIPNARDTKCQMILPNNTMTTTAM